MKKVIFVLCLSTLGLPVLAEHVYEYQNLNVLNGADYIQTKGKWTIAMSTSLSAKFISVVLYVPEIDQNLLSVSQLLEKGYKVLFEDKSCMIKDSNNL